MDVMMYKAAASCKLVNVLQEHCSSIIYYILQKEARAYQANLCKPTVFIAERRRRHNVTIWPLSSLISFRVVAAALLARSKFAACLFQCRRSRVDGRPDDHLFGITARIAA